MRPPAVHRQHGDERPRCDPRDEAIAAGYLPPRDRASRQASTAPAQSETPLFRFIPIGDYLSAVAAPSWLIRDVLERDSLVLIFGDPEVGKSFLSMDWAACVATGTAWKGYTVEQGPVLYINGEGRHGVNRRFTAWAIANQCDLTNAPLYIASTTTALTDEVARAELLAVVAAFQEQYGAPVLIVIDTLARNYGPGDENSTQDMAQAVATCDALREMTGAVVVLVHHSGHGDKTRARGAMALHAAVDVEYRMHRAPESRDTTFECTKMKDAEKPAPLRFRIAAVELGVQDDEGREVTSAVLQRVEYVESEPIEAPRRGRPDKHRKAALDCLRSLHARALANVMQDGRAEASARVLVETWRDACLGLGVPRNRYHEAFAQLKAAGFIRVEHGFVYPVEDA